MNTYAINPPHHPMTNATEGRKYHFGVDLAFKPKWWQRVVAFFFPRRFAKYKSDMSCSVAWEKRGDEYHLIDIKHF